MFAENVEFTSLFLFGYLVGVFARRVFAPRLCQFLDLADRKALLDNAVIDFELHRGVIDRE